MAVFGHGGKEIVERILQPAQAKEKIKGIRQRIPISGPTSREIIDLAYGWFTPLEGFMGKADVDAVCNKMQLADGTVWPIPIVFDLSNQEISDYGVKVGDTLLLTYQNQPLATLEVSEIFQFDKQVMNKTVYGTTEEKHPGVKRTNAYKGNFVAGKVILVNPPKINPPFDEYFFTPKLMREKLAEKGWERSVVHQTRNVPHTGHEWLMKHAWIATHGELPIEKTLTGVVVNAIIGEKRKGDYIDEAIILCQDMQKKAKYFRDEVFLCSLTFWDMRYAGPREAIFHAILRTNLGCTHHMFGRDHAGVGTYYGPYDAHRIFKTIPKDALRITPIFVAEWWYAPGSGEVTCSSLDGHEPQHFSGTVIRSIIEDGVKPPTLIFRPEVFDLVLECAEKYGFGSPFVTDEYLAKRPDRFTVPPMDI